MHIPGFGALLAIVLLLLTGVLVSNMIGRTLMELWDELLNRIPFVRAIYGGVKNFSTTILSSSGNSFKKVLLIEYPRKGVWSIGFQTAADVPLVSDAARRAAGVRLHPDDAESDRRLHRHGAALARRSSSE